MNRLRLNVHRYRTSPWLVSAMFFAGFVLGVWWRSRP